MLTSRQALKTSQNRSRARVGASEKSLVRAILRYLATLDACWVIKVHGGVFQSAGVPDIVGCFHGRFFALEVKRPGGAPTPLQRFVIDKLKRAEAVVVVVYSVEDVRLVVEHMVAEEARCVAKDA